jgi:hypothetical protein
MTTTTVCSLPRSFSLSKTESHDSDIGRRSKPAALLPLLTCPEQHIGWTLDAPYDGLVKEISHLFQRCSVDSTAISNEERRVNEFLIGFVCLIDASFPPEGNDQFVAVLLLFRKAITTPSNLELLLRIADADSQTRLARCSAMDILRRLGQVNTTWSIKLQDGSYFMSNLVSVCAKALVDDMEKDSRVLHRDDVFFLCSYNSPNNLLWALGMTKDEPAKVLVRVYSFNWMEILP